MIKKYDLYTFGIFCIVISLIFFYTRGDTHFFFGVVYLILFFCILTKWWRDILRHVFRFEAGFVSFLLSAFASIFFVSSIEGILIAWYTTTLFLTSASLACSGIGTYALRLFLLSRSRGFQIIGNGKKQYIQIFSKFKLLSLVYIGGLIITFYIFFDSRDIETMFSPWQSLSTWILPLMFGLSVLLGFLIFSKQKTIYVIVMIIFYSFLLHLYLPLSYELPWGGDVWRHIAVEKQFVSGNIVYPVLFGPEAKWREFIGVDIPEAFLIPQKYTYGQFWSLAVVIHQFTNISFETINIWLIPILWSLIFPLVLFRIGRIVFQSWRAGLLLSWLSFIAFPLQVLGALTLPISLAILSFFFVFMLCLQYIGRPCRIQLWLLLLFVGLMIFGYALSFILMIFVIFGSWIFKIISRHAQSRRLWWSYIFLLILFGIIAIPVVELFAGTSYIQKNISLIYIAKQIVGHMFGWFYASGIRPHDILIGNLFFNHTPDYAFVSSVFTSWRWWIIPFMVLLWCGALYGIYIFTRGRKSTIFLLPAWMFISLLGAYKIGWFLLDGDRLFIRRLDPFLSVFILLFVCFSILFLFYRIRFSTIFLRRSSAVIFILAVSWFGISTYASGPDMRIVNLDEYAVATLSLSQSEDLDIRDMCILADTWVLLPLEGLSSGKIVGGNFPIDYNFGQEERVRLYETFLYGVVTTSTVYDMFKVAKRERCTVILPAENLSEERVDMITSFSSVEPNLYSGYMIWIIYSSPLLTAAN